MVNERKKRRWFELGAESFARVRPGLYDDLIYPCPICLGRFTIEALAQNQLSAEHVPPESLGGRDLLLTCRNCNNSSGTKLDAHAKIKEDVQLAFAGTLEHPHRVRAMFGDLVVNAELHTSGGKYSLQVPTNLKIKEDVQLAFAGTLEHPHRVRAMFGDLVVNAELHTSGGKYSLQVPTKINKPGTRETLQNVVQTGTQLTVEHRRYAELGAKISWFRSGYLALFAVTGYELALNPAFEIVRKQILECDERKMITFTSEAPEHIPL